MTPRLCMTCLAPVRALVALFVNAIGWLDCCQGCAREAEARAVGGSR